MIESQRRKMEKRNDDQLFSYLPAQVRGIREGCFRSPVILKDVSDEYPLDGD